MADPAPLGDLFERLPAMIHLRESSYLIAGFSKESCSLVGKRRVEFTINQPTQLICSRIQKHGRIRPSSQHTLSPPVDTPLMLLLFFSTGWSCVEGRMTRKGCYGLQSLNSNQLPSLWCRRPLVLESRTLQLVLDTRFEPKRTYDLYIWIMNHFYPNTFLISESKKVR